MALSLEIPLCPSKARSVGRRMRNAEHGKVYKKVCHACSKVALFPLQYSFGIRWNLLLGSTKSSLLLQYSDVLFFSLHNRQLVGFKLDSRLPYTAIKYNWYPRFLESSEVVTDGLCNCSSGSVNCVNQIFCVYFFLVTL